MHYFYFCVLSCSGEYGTQRLHFTAQYAVAVSYIADWQTRKEVLTICLLHNLVDLKYEYRVDWYAGLTCKI